METSAPTENSNTESGVGTDCADASDHVNIVRMPNLVHRYRDDTIRFVGAKHIAEIFSATTWDTG